MNISKIKVSEQDRKLVSDFMGEKYPLEIDFNWLMPVVEKIGEILNQADIDFAKDLYYFKLGKDVTIFSVSIFAPIEFIYQHTIDFVQWYNEQ